MYQNNFTKHFNADNGRNKKKVRDNHILYFNFESLENLVYLLTNEETINREFGAFRNIPDAYSRYVISLDKENMIRDGIKHIYVIDLYVIDFFMNDLF